MALSGKSLKWALGLAGIVLLALAAYAYVFGTRAMLEQAEAFAFRRMTVSKLSEESTFRFFFVTNRKPAESLRDIDDRFTSERNGGLSFGSFDTRIEPSLGLGMIINPSEWFLNEEIQLLEARDSEREEFVQALRRSVEASPQRSLLLVVHGFREAFPSALRKTAFLAHVLDINTPVLVFDWPGNQGSSLRGYRGARRVAEASGEDLAAVIKLIVKEVGPQRLWLMANSMGGQVVVDAFGLLTREADFSDTDTEIENVVLTAPDVDHARFNQDFKHDVLALADNVTVYVSSNDRALLASRLINWQRRLGESTLDPANPGQVQQAEAISQLLEPGNARMVLVDVTPVNRTRNFHNFSLETPEFFSDLYLRLTLRNPPVSRELYFLETPGGVRYFVLTRGR